MSDEFEYDTDGERVMIGSSPLTRKEMDLIIKVPDLRKLVRSILKMKRHYKRYKKENARLKRELREALAPELILGDPIT